MMCSRCSTENNQRLNVCLKMANNRLSVVLWGEEELGMVRKSLARIGSKSRAREWKCCHRKRTARVCVCVLRVQKGNRNTGQSKQLLFAHPDAPFSVGAVGSVFLRTGWSPFGWSLRQQRQRQDREWKSREMYDHNQLKDPWAERAVSYRAVKEFRCVFLVQS